MRRDADDTETIGMTELDTLITQAAPSGAFTLEGLEDGVWSRVAQAQAKGRDRTLRVAALGVAAGIGGLAGAVSEPQIGVDRGELSIFSPRMAATPLDVKRALG
jgi:hypothetical protein